MNAPTQNKSVANPKIFVIEENDREREVLETVLHREQCKVHSIGFSREILKVLKTEGPFDLIILAFNKTSQISGVKVFRALAKEAPTTPVAIFCDLTETAIIKELKSYGARHLLSKPFSVKGVLWAVGQAVRPDNPLEGTVEHR